jgi:hypothetical protein
MRDAAKLSGRLDRFAREHPRLMWAINATMMLFVALVLLTTTEAPLVLYQAF